MVLGTQTTRFLIGEVGWTFPVSASPFMTCWKSWKGLSSTNSSASLAGRLGCSARIPGSATGTGTSSTTSLTWGTGIAEGSAVKSVGTWPPQSPGQKVQQ